MRGGQVRTVVGHLWKVCRGVTLRDVAETAANRRLDHQIDVWVGDQSQLDVGQLQRQLQCRVRKADLRNAFTRLSCPATRRETDTSRRRRGYRF